MAFILSEVSWGRREPHMSDMSCSDIGVTMDFIGVTAEELRSIIELTGNKVLLSCKVDGNTGFIVLDILKSEEQ